jgi:hypothetical protein
VCVCVRVCEAKRSLEVLGGDKDRQLHTLWKKTKISEILHPKP